MASWTPNSIVESLPSTNDAARALADQGAPHGTWIAARVQTAGRGRAGRDWVSQPGNLFLSVVLRLRELRWAGWVPLVCAVVCARACARLGARVAIKWPNDLWVSLEGEWYKVGGILCEGSTQGAQTSIIAGIGINCAHAPDLDLQREARVQPAHALGISADALRAETIGALPAAIRELEVEGPQAWAAAFWEFSVLRVGSQIEVFPKTPRQDAESKTAWVQGLGENGELLVREKNGTQHALMAEEVSIRGEY